jgi:hypothetical protein
LDIPLGRTAAWGEVGLTGDVRPVARPALRRSEVERISAGPIIDRDSGVMRVTDALLASGLDNRRYGTVKIADRSA